MALVNHSDLLEDSRFKEVRLLKKKDVPHQLHWYLKEEYFTDELLGIHSSEVSSLQKIATEAFEVFQLATNKIVKDRSLSLLNIPRFFEDCIYHSWEQKDLHPFFTGRFDINGGIGKSPASVIEFNADTFSTLPETIYWQPLQAHQLNGSHNNFNQLHQHLTENLQKISRQLNNPQPVILASSFGYKEDYLNCTSILDIANQLNFKTYYQDLEHVVFSEEGIFYYNNDEYIKADIWFKMIPWDWMFNEEPELARIMSKIVLENLAVVLNPAYTTIWQNKLFLAYITENFPNSVIAETYTTKRVSFTSFVQKPIYGRIGENILLKDEAGKEYKSKGDYEAQKVVYQKYYPLPKDLENYYYQVGMFYTNQPSALNLRTQESKIITDDCEFMSHYII